MTTDKQGHQEEGHRDGSGSGSHNLRTWELSYFLLKERSQMGGCSYRLDNIGSFCEVQCQVIGGNDHKQEQMHYKGDKLKRRVGKHWNMLPKEVVEPPFLEKFHKTAGQGPEQNALSLPLVLLGLNLEFIQMTSRAPLQTNFFFTMP